MSKGKEKGSWKKWFNDYIFMPGIWLVVFPVFVLSGLATSFSSFYYPLRLADSGEMVELLVVNKKLDPLYSSRSGVLDIAYTVKIKGHEKPFAVVTDLYDEIEIGHLYSVFYSPQLQWGIVSNEPLTWLSTLWYDSIHKPYITISAFTLITFALFFFGMSNLGSECMLVYQKYKLKYESESDAVLRNAKLVGAIVPYGIVVAFVYMLSIYAIYSVFKVEKFSDFVIGIVAAVVVMSIAFSPYLLLKVRVILGNLRFIQIVVALTKIAISLTATIRLVIFINENDVTTFDNIQKLLLDLTKFIFTM